MATKSKPTKRKAVRKPPKPASKPKPPAIHGHRKVQVQHSLTPEEQADFVRLDALVVEAAGLISTTWDKIAPVLKEIKERELYRSVSLSFDQYCKERFNFGARRARQLIQGYKVKLELQQTDHEGAKAIDRPSKAAALGKHPPAKRSKVVRAATKSGKATTKALQPAAKVFAGLKLLKLQQALSHLKTEVLIWEKGDIELLTAIIETAAELKGLCQ